MEVFQDYAFYYNAFYGDKDYTKEAHVVDTLLRKYGNNIHSIIDLGCGTGRHDIELAKLGYKCHGVDLSEAMIKIAQESLEKNDLKTSFEVGDIRNYEKYTKYDAVVSLFHVMSYQNENKDVFMTLRTVRNLLNKGGIFVFDFWYGPGVLSDKPCVRVKEVSKNEKKLIRLARPIMHDKKDIVDVNYEVLIVDKDDRVQTIEETHCMRYFFRPELELFLEQTGFEIIEQLDCNTLKETDYTSWTSYIVAKAI